MAIIDTLRPTATISSLDWTSVPTSGTAHAVTSDNSDATYVVGQIGNAQLVLSVGPHGVPANHRRHLARVRARGRSGQVTANVRVPGSLNVAFSSLEFSSSFAEVDGSWGGGLPPTTAGDFGVAVTVQSASVNISELYVDIDSREQPTYDPQIADDSSVTTTITSTSAPIVSIINVDTDSLPVARWRAWVTPQGSSAVVWDTGSVAGNPVPQQTAPLINGSYTLHVQLWSALGDGSEFAGAEDTLNFTVNLQPVIPPVSLEVSQVAGTPLFEIIATTPNTLADYDVPPMLEVQRSGCGGEESGEWVTIALTGPVTVTGTASYVDWNAPRTQNSDECADSEVCEFEYRARFVGTKSGLLVTSEWVYETVSTASVAWRFTGNTLNPTVELDLNATPVSGFGLPSIATTSLGYTTDPELNTGTMPSSSFSASRYLYASVVSGVLRYSWDVNTQGWVGEGSTSVARVTSPVHDGAGSLEATETMGSGFAELRFNDASGLRDLSGDGEVLSAWVYLPPGAPGTGWQARLEVQNPSFTWIPGPDFPLMPGWQQITYTPSPALLASCRSIGFAIGANDVNTTQSVYVDTLEQRFNSADFQLGQLRRVRLLSAKSSSSGQRGFHLRTSADGFASDVYATAVPTTRTTWSSYDLALNIPVTGYGIELHVHSYAVSGGGMEFDNIEMYFGDPVQHSLVWEPADVLLRTEDADGALWAAGCGIASWDVDKPFTAQLGVMGGQQVTAGSPGGHDLTLNLAVTSQEQLEHLERILERHLVLVSPSDSAEQWSAPSDVGVQLVKIRGVRTLVTKMIGTGPEPAHEPGEVLE